MKTQYRAREGVMKTLNLKVIVAVIAALAAFITRPLSARAGDVLHIQTSFVFDGNSAVDAGTCDPTTLTPVAGDPVCEAKLSQTYTIAGDFVGTDYEEVIIAVYANGTTLFDDFETWTGTLKQTYTGSLVGLTYDGVAKADDSTTALFRILDGTGTGGLAGITGNGYYTSATGLDKILVKLPGNR